MRPSRGGQVIDAQLSEPVELTSIAERLFRRLFYSALIVLPSVIAVATFFDHSLNVTLMFWLAELLLLLILGLAMYEVQKRIARPTPLSVVLSLVVLATSLTAALLNAVDQATALGHLAMTATHFAIGMAIFSLFAAAWRTERTALLCALMLSALLQVLTTFVLIGVASRIPAFDWAQFHGGVGNVRQLGFFGIAALSLVAAMLVSKPVERNAYLLWIALLIGMTFVNLIGGRAAFVASMVAIAFVIIAGPKGSRTKNIFAFAGVWLVSAPISMIYIPPSGDWGLPRIFGTAERLTRGEDFSSGRWEIWTRTVEDILVKPLIGSGEGQFRLASEQFGFLINHPHNFVLQFLFQWGAIGTLAICALATIVAGAAWRNRRTSPDVFLPAAAVVLAMTAMATLEGNFYHVYPSLITAIALALLATVARQPEHR